MLAGRTKLLSVSELASAFGLTPEALRFYETRGLLNPKQPAARVSAIITITPGRRSCGAYASSSTTGAASSRT
jgi:hypothetical protein